MKWRQEIKQGLYEKTGSFWSPVGLLIDFAANKWHKVFVEIHRSEEGAERIGVFFLV